ANKVVDWLGDAMQNADVYGDDLRHAIDMMVELGAFCDTKLYNVTIQILRRSIHDEADNANEDQWIHDALSLLDIADRKLCIKEEFLRDRLMERQDEMTQRTQYNSFNNMITEPARVESDIRGLFEAIVGEGLMK